MNAECKKTSEIETGEAGNTFIQECVLHFLKSFFRFQWKDCAL